MYHGLRVALIIPALDEEAAIAQLVGQVDREIVDDVVVADNGSADRTAELAQQAGARVVFAPRRGYGSACLAGIAAVPDADVVVFMDGDGSDDPEQISLLLAELQGTGADLVIGSRTRGPREPGSLTAVQVFGNALACGLIHLLWGIRFTDLGPFRAIRRAALQCLNMADPDYGWTVEMQIKAVQQGLECVEVPVRHRKRRAGKSKVSGTVCGSYRAGRRILAYIATARLQELGVLRQPRPGS